VGKENAANIRNKLNKKKKVDKKKKNEALAGGIMWQCGGKMAWKRGWA